MTGKPPVLVRRIVAEKRMLVGFVAISLIADAGLYGLAVYPWMLKVDVAKRRATAAAASLEAARQRFDSVRIEADDRTRAETELHAFHREILPRSLAGARSLTLSRLATLADDHDLLMERRASAPEREEDSPLARLQVSMLLSGGYRDIRRFIHAIETAPEFLIIEQIVLSQGNEGEAGEILELGLSTYYWQGDDVERDEP